MSELETDIYKCFVDSEDKKRFLKSGVILLSVIFSEIYNLTSIYYQLIAHNVVSKYRGLISP